ncbi:MAG: peptidylprolyl isomerase [Acidimicrobiia bacterium]|nr:peptidylprolyl isomerase [Acidimicrobiia bacterium]MDX2468280.1 peptidylprolyl isomerase [Acidimicrobiia bacterium]
MPVFRRLLVVLALALLAASCSTADTLATVNGDEITKSDLYALRPSYENGGSSVTGEQLRQDVSDLVLLEAASQAAAADFGLELTDAVIDERIANPPGRYASVLNPAVAAPDANETTRRSRAIATLLIDAVAPSLIAAEPGGLEALISEQPDTVAQVCVRHIAVASIADGEAVLARLIDGEDFVEVAAEVSLDQATPEGLIGGDDGNCLEWLTAIGPEFANLAATAELGVPLGPVPNGSGWSVIRIEDRVSPSSVADLEANIMDYVNPALTSTLYSTWVTRAVRNADIDVSATIGRWSEVGLGIAPPGE